MSRSKDGNDQENIPQKIINAYWEIKKIEETKSIKTSWTRVMLDAAAYYSVLEQRYNNVDKKPVQSSPLAEKKQPELLKNELITPDKPGKPRKFSARIHYGPNFKSKPIGKILTAGYVSAVTEDTQTGLPGK